MTTDRERAGFRGWSAPGGRPTTLVLLRHGETPYTKEKRFSGGLAGTNPGLSARGREQVQAAAAWLGPLTDRVAAIVASPVRRTWESAEIVSAALGLPVSEEPGFAEMEFGAWDGLTFAEVHEQHPAELQAWLGSLDVAPAGGESFRAVEARVLAGLDRVLTAHPGGTVVVVSHVTPIKVLVARALGAPLESVYRTELSTASVSIVSFFPPAESSAPIGSLRLFNARPGDLLP